MSQQDQNKFSKLANTHILIIGGSSGLGYAVAEASLEQNASHIIISSSTSSRIDTAISRLRSSYPSKTKDPASITGHVCDLSTQSALEANIVALLDFATENKTKKLHHVVHTAGDPLAVQKLADVTLDSMIQAGMVRFFSTLMLGKHLPEYMVPGAHSSLTLTTGAVSQRPHSDWAVVGSYATGLHGVCRGLALDLAPLRVNLVSPGYVETDLWRNHSPEQRTAIRQGVISSLPTGRLPMPEDVAEQYLASMRDWNSTGTVYCSNGGSLLK